MRILLVDDDAALLESLQLVLGAEGHTVTTRAAGKPALALLEHERFDAIVCDVNMPNLDGFTLCRQLRARGDATPLILLTSRDGEIDEALGLDLGADDYMTKPFSVRVLLARLGALARRATAPATADAIVRAGDLVIDRDRLTIRFRDTPIAATLTELRILAALAEHPGRVLSRDRLLELGREDDSVVAPRLVDTYVGRLRRKLDEVHAGAGQLVETVTGAGYRWRA